MTVPTMLCRKLRIWRACQYGARASLLLALLGTTVCGSTRPASLQVSAGRPAGPAALSDSVTVPHSPEAGRARAGPGSP